MIGVQSLSVWIIRLTVAILLLLASEIIVWTQPLAHATLDVGVRLLGYLLIATLTLDIAQRYRIRDSYDAMVLFAATASLHGLLINPAISWQAFTDSLLTRIIGSDALVMLIMWGIFLALLRPKNRRYTLYASVGALWLGIYWGFWLRWIPELRGTFPSVSLIIAWGIVATVFASGIACYLFATRHAHTVTADALMLSPLQWGIALVVILLLFLYQAILQTITLGAIVFTVMILGLCWLILWLRRDPDEPSLLEQHLPLQWAFTGLVPLIALAFMGASWVAFNLPRLQTGFVDQLWLMEVGSFVVGMLWLPLVATVIAIRALDHTLRQGLNI